MNLQLSRNQRIDTLDPAAQNLSAQAGFHLAPVLELLGISHIRVIADEGIGGTVYRVAEVDFFDGVPEEVVKWADPVANSMAPFLSSLGITGMGFDYSDSEDKDLAELRRVWGALVAPPPPPQPPAVKSWSVAESREAGADEIRTTETAADAEPVRQGQPGEIIL